MRTLRFLGVAVALLSVPGFVAEVRAQPPSAPETSIRPADRQHLQEIVTLLADAVRQIKDKEARHVYFALLAGYEAGMGNLSGAVAFAKQAGPARELAEAQMASGQASTGDLDGALKRAEGIQDMGLRFSAFSKIALLRARARDFVGAAKALDARMPYQPVFQMMALVRQIARLQAQSGDIDGASAFLQRKSDPATLAYLSGLKAKAGDADGAARLLQAARGFKGLLVGAGVEGEVAKGLLEAGDVDGALREVADHPELAKVEELRAALLKALADRRDFAAALRIAEGIEDPSDRALALAELLPARVAAGERVDPATLEATAALVGRIEVVQLRAMALAALATAQRGQGNVEAADRMLQEASGVAKTAKPLLAGAAFRFLITARLQHGDFEAALGLADQIRSLEGIGDEMLREGLLEIGAAQWKAGRRAEAARTFEVARTEARRVADDGGDALASVGFRQARAGDVAGALAWVRQERKPEVRALCLIACAAAVAHSESGGATAQALFPTP